MISFSSSLDIHYSLQLKGINVTQIYVSTIYFILKQGYMFRLKVSHLQVPTTFSLPDALLTLASHSVYICGIHLSLNFLKRF
jgi:hypothetical protein